MTSVSFGQSQSQCFPQDKQAVNTFAKFHFHGNGFSVRDSLCQLITVQRFKIAERRAQETAGPQPVLKLRSCFSGMYFLSRKWHVSDPVSITGENLFHSLGYLKKSHTKMFHRETNSYFIHGVVQKKNENESLRLGHMYKSVHKTDTICLVRN